MPCLSHMNPIRPNTSVVLTLFVSAFGITFAEGDKFLSETANLARQVGRLVSIGNKLLDGKYSQSQFDNKREDILEDLEKLSGHLAEQTPAASEDPANPAKYADRQKVVSRFTSVYATFLGKSENFHGDAQKEFLATLFTKLEDIDTKTLFSLSADNMEEFLTELGLLTPEPDAEPDAAANE